MKRTIYEAPRTILYKVEVEGVICGSIDVQAKSPGASTSAQEINFDFGSDNNFAILEKDDPNYGWDK